MSIDQILEFVKKPEGAVLIGSLVSLLVLSLIIRSLKHRKLKRVLVDLDVQYNTMRSSPLSYKLNKTIALARINQEVALLVPKCKEEFDKVQANFTSIGEKLAEADDFIFMHKTKLAMQTIAQVEEQIQETSDIVSVLSQYMDQVLEKESEQRAEITRLKEVYRNLKLSIQDQSNELSFVMEYLESFSAEIEADFTNFEEYVYASEFDQSKLISDRIHERLVHLTGMIDKTPKLMMLAKGKIQAMLEEVSTLYLQAREVGVVLNHLEIPKNLDLISEIVKNDLQALQKGELQSSDENLQDCVTRLNQLTQQIEREAKSYEQYTQLFQENQAEVKDKMEHMKQFSAVYQKYRDRFGYENWDTFIEEKQQQLQALDDRLDELNLKHQQKKTAYTSLLVALKEYDEALGVITKEINTLSEKLQNACSDEERALKQREKLQLIMHEITVKIRKHRLPSIGDAYGASMKEGHRHLAEIDQLLREMPLNIERLNVVLNRAIEHIYKLYNNVNNLIGVAGMVENAIVYGNKYRSTYPDVDSELTRAELAFRNGEYTQALTIAIQVIEKIHPGSYERLIRSQAA